MKKFLYKFLEEIILFFILIILFFIYNYHNLFFIPFLLSPIIFLHKIILGQSYGYFFILLYLFWGYHQEKWLLKSPKRIKVIRDKILILKELLFYILFSTVITYFYLLVFFYSKRYYDFVFKNSLFLKYAYLDIPSFLSNFLSQCYLSFWAVIGLGIMYICLKDYTHYRNLKIQLLIVFFICIVINFIFPIKGPLYKIFRNGETLPLYGYVKFRKWFEIIYKQIIHFQAFPQKHITEIFEILPLFPDLYTVFIVYIVFSLKKYLLFPLKYFLLGWFILYQISIIYFKINYFPIEILSIAIGAFSYLLISRVKIFK